MTAIFPALPLKKQGQFFFRSVGFICPQTTLHTHSVCAFVPDGPHQQGLTIKGQWPNCQRPGQHLEGRLRGFTADGTVPTLLCHSQFFEILFLTLGLMKC